jgi:hypothetical protein
MNRFLALLASGLSLALTLAVVGCGSGSSTLVDAGFLGDLAGDVQDDDGKADGVDQTGVDIKNNEGTDPEIIPDVKEDVPAACTGPEECQFLLEGGVQCMVATCTVDGVCSLVEAGDGVGCDDQSLCTTADACDGGLCVGKPVVCVPEGPCFQASCNGTTGECESVALADDSDCDDASVCTLNDRCLDGQCTGDALPCEDGIFCTQDLCDPVKGCQFPNADNGTSCEDGDLCTVSDVCMGGRCVTGFETLCDDKNVCTRDWCDVAQGCLTENLSGGICDDGDACTGDDTCADGVCAGATPM